MVSAFLNLKMLSFNQKMLVDKNASHCGSEVSQPVIHRACFASQSLWHFGFKI